MGVRRFLWKWRWVSIAAPTMASIAIALRLAGFLQLGEWAALDLYFRLRPAEPADERIVIVGIDEPDIRYAGQWPIPDKVLAELLAKLKQQNPRAIGLDLYRDLPVPPGHDALVAVYNSTPNLIGIQKVVGDPKNPGVAPPPELKKLGQIAANDFIIDADGKVRRTFLYLTDSEGQFVFGLGFRLAWIYIEQIQGIGPELTEEQFVKLGEGIFPPFEGNDGGYVRANAAGYQILLNFRGASCRVMGSKCPYQIVSMRDVLEDKIPPDLIRDRIVLVGSTAESLRDHFFTPYSSGLVTIPQPTSGVEIHAHLTSQILSTALQERPLIKIWDENLELLWIFFWSSAGAILSWRCGYSGTKIETIARVALIILAVVSLVSSTFVAFIYGWWIPVVPPLLAFGLSSIAIAIYIARTAGDIRKAFGRYVNNEVVASLLENPQGLKLGGECRRVTILLSDLRGFTAIAKPLPPEKVVTLLNIYLEKMSEVIDQYHGTIDKFIGDAILVIFGAPNSGKDDADRAVACALAMQLAMEEVNAKLTRLGLPFIEMGIGIHTGEVVVGNIGSQNHANYTAIGNEVNLTSRIESYTVGGQVLISDVTRNEVKTGLRINDKISVQPKGFDQPIAIHDIGGIAGRYCIFLPRKETNLFTLKQEIPLYYTILDGKHVSNTKYKGSLVKFSFKGAQMRADHLIEQFSNIKINLLAPNAREGEDLYAKVTGKSQEGNGYLLRFTSVPPAIGAVLSALYDSLLPKK